jgi:shikimate 5-dehydrogenase
VNATPVGLEGGPDPDGSPLPEDVGLDDSIVVFDTVYAPERTPLLAEAASRGAKVVGGLEMFTRQAARQQAMFAAEG